MRKVMITRTASKTVFENVKQTSSRAKVLSKFGQVLTALEFDSVQLHVVENRGLY